MSEKYSINNFTFESREVYDRAKQEMEVIRQMQERADFHDARTALRIYNKAVAEKSFSTIVGYCFLQELREIVVEAGIAEADMLADIPVKEFIKYEVDTIVPRGTQEGRYRRLYEGQKLLNRKFKVALAALVILLAGFVVINFRFEYSIFTYFTNYKANMEEELIDKYEKWQSELESRENALEQKEEAAGKEPE